MAIKKGKHICDITNCFMCSHVTEDWRRLIEISASQILLKKGERFIQEGEPMTGVYFVNKGTVKVHKAWQEKELIVRFAHHGAIVGHRGIYANFESGHTYPISATAIEPTEVCFVELPFFMSTLRVNPGFTFELMMFFAEELRQSEQNMRNLVHMSVKSRLALALFKLESQFGVSDEGAIAISLSKQDLASYVGTTYETLFRMLNELVNDKLVGMDGKKTFIKDREGLKLVIESQ